MFKSIVFSLIFLSEHQKKDKMSKLLHYNWFHLISPEGKVHMETYIRSALLSPNLKYQSSIILSIFYLLLL
jgi:hypothetical protein